jgi:hypothetical protein
MGRPRKNRVGEYAGLLAEELAFHLSKELNIQIGENKEEYLREIELLRGEIKELQKHVFGLEQRLKSNKARPKLGKWVPGGPGRPPKDAKARVAAFSSRSDRETPVSADDS